VPIIGGLGRLVPNKGVDILIEACVHLKARNAPFQCVIHGVEEDGGVASFVEKRKLANLSETEFSLPGWSEAPDEFLRSVDIFCMPSRREVLSSALLEALAAGRPIVCTRVPGLETAFDDGVEGFFVDIEDSEQLADALELLIRDRGLRLTMGEAARRRAAQFDVKVVGVQLRKALEELTA
jgi:glycosyltransferase involved in cell wall biosynthesis